MQSLLLIYLVWPVGSVLWSLKNIKGREFSVLFVLMGLFWGLNAYTMPTANWVGGDIVNYMDDAIAANKLTWAEVFSQNDYYLWIVGKMLTYLSINRTYIAVGFYVIYALLFMRSFRILIKFYNPNSTTAVKYIYLATVFLAYPFTFFNALRFATATMFFVWILLEVVINKKKLYWVLFLVPPLIHYAYWFFIPVPFVWLLLRNRLLICFFLFLVSYSLSSLHTSYAIFNFAQNNLDENMTTTLSGYASEDSRYIIDERYEYLKMTGNSNRTIFVTSLSIRNNSMMIILGLLTLLGYRTIKKNIQLKYIVTLMLICVSGANIAASISNGDRFYHLSCLIIACLFFYIYYALCPAQESTARFIKKNQFLIYLMLFTISMYGMIHIYTMSNAYNFLNMLTGNIFTSLLL